MRKLLKSIQPRSRSPVRETPMKICIFGDARSAHVHGLVSGLIQRGFNVHVVTHKPFDVVGATVERFVVPPPGLTNPRRWHARRAHYLRGFMRRYDVVNIHFLEDWGFTPEIIEDGCLVATAWGSDIVPPPDADPPTPGLLASRISMLRHAAATTTCGPAFASTVAEFAGIDVARIDVVPFGVDLSVFRPAAVQPLEEAEINRVGFFKGFRAVYGATYLIQAIPAVLARRPNTRFELVGEGRQLPQCRQLAIDRGVESSITWLPRQPHRNIPGLLAQWNLTVIPSVCEAFGVAALESSAMRLPVVASDVGGLRDTVHHGETGLLVPPEIPDALAEAIITSLRNPRRCRQMGQAGREMVEREYDCRLIHDRWIALYERARDRVSTVV